MQLLITYLIVVVLGEAAVIAISVMLDRVTSPFMSTVVFFVLFFATIWLAWRVSVWITEPRRAT